MNADIEFSANIGEAASSAESVVNQAEVKVLASIVENRFALLKPDKDQEYQPVMASSAKPNENMLAGVFRRRNGEPRQPLRNTLRGGGRLFGGSCGRGGCG